MDKISSPGTLRRYAGVYIRKEKIAACIPLRGKTPFSAFPAWPPLRRGYMLRNKE